MASKLKLTELLHPDSAVAAITINADNSVTIPTQSTTNLAYTGTLTGGTGVVNIGSGQVYKDASGNVGIGTTTTSSGRLSVVAGTGTTGNSLFLSNLDGTYNPFAQIQHNGINGVKFSNSSSFGGTAGNLTIEPASNLIFSPGQTERARIDSSGNLLVGTTTTYGRMALAFSGASGDGLSITDTRDLSGDVYINFRDAAGSVTGSISRNTTSSVAYNTSSDYRLKENVAPMTGALQTVAALKPVTYKWKADGSAGQGFIAHELQEVVPDCVTGEKDAVDKDGKPQYQGVDTSFLVATLVSALQEQQALIQDLTTRLTTLEGN